MNLVIDQGNTFTKAGVFDKGKLIYFNFQKLLDKKLLCDFNSTNSVEKIIMSSVQKTSFTKKELCEILELTNDVEFYELNHETKIPIHNLYKSPKTLGKDRLAALTGASKLFPGDPKLVIDAGTAITIDYLNEKNQFEGGNISPGIQTRFTSLHQNTKLLPKLNPNDNVNFIGQTTEEAIWAGVQNGVLLEIQGYISHFKQQNKNIKTIFTGGDADFFVKKLKNAIFVDSNLVLNGLNTILEYNSSKII